MNKITFYYLLFLSIFLNGCNSKDFKSNHLEIGEPFKIVHITPDSCKLKKLEERNFTLKIPEAFKESENDISPPIHYVRYEKKGENGLQILKIAPAEIDLQVYSKLIDKKLEGEIGYKLLFDVYKPLIDKYALGKDMKRLVSDFCSYPSIYVYSKSPNEEIKINNFPANYSDVIIHYESNGTMVWQHYVYFIIPNKDNLKKSLTGEYIREVYNTNKGISKEDFLKSDSFKIISNIQFIN